MGEAQRGVVGQGQVMIAVGCVNKLLPGEAAGRGGRVGTRRFSGMQWGNGRKPFCEGQAGAGEAAWRGEKRDSGLIE